MECNSVEKLLPMYYLTFEAVKTCQKITTTVSPLVPECQLFSQIESRKKEIQNNEV